MRQMMTKTHLLRTAITIAATTLTLAVPLVASTQNAEIGINSAVKGDVTIISADSENKYAKASIPKVDAIKEG